MLKAMISLELSSIGAPILGAVSIAPALLIDVVIVCLLAFNLVRGWRLGFVRQVCSLLGFVTGLFLGALLVPGLVGAGPAGFNRAGMVIAVVVGSGLLLGAAAELIGKDFGHYVWKTKARRLDGGLGVVIGGVITVVGVWLVGSMFFVSPFTEVSRGLHQSAVMKLISYSGLPRAPQTIAHLQAVINPAGFPPAFAGLEPVPSGGIGQASRQLRQEGSAAGRGSTMRIEGLGCGSLKSGTGFMVAPGLVMTAAHVVAGQARSVVVEGVVPHVGIPVYMDTSQDVAILRVSGLVGAPLPLATQAAPRGQWAVLLGFPDNGPFAATEAGVLGRADIDGLDIYSRALVTRDAYILQTHALEGNSGGPVLLANGQVIGLLFARSAVVDKVAYALASPTLAAALAGVKPDEPAVNTGPCIGA
jgi:S1-C subfamily serine protease